MQERMTEVFSCGSVVLLQDPSVLTPLIQPFPPYHHIQIGIDFVVDNRTEINFWDHLKITRQK